MKLAVMQPYFFPYIGYWQLINAVDKFVLFDDVQYIRHGWINRNRVLKHGGGWQYIIMPLQKYMQNELIKNIYPQNERDWKKQILRQLEHYSYGRKKAPFYDETIGLLTKIFSKISNENVTGINFLITSEICKYLDISTEIIVSSEQNFNYELVLDKDDWALKISEQLNAREYINPVGGKDMFDSLKFHSNKIKLSFLKSDEIRYDQVGEFEPSLSVLDVLMFNGRTGSQKLLKMYSIETV